MADTLGRARDRVAAFADELAKQDAVRMMTSRFARTIAADLRLLLATREPSEADVERVARAIAKEARYPDDDGWRSYTHLARAAIAAMLEPRG